LVATYHGLTLFGAQTENHNLSIKSRMPKVTIRP
jgi:hypothetical protein